MSLTRYLPTPSDRMGILWTLLSVKDAIVIEYGTAGTTTYALKTFMFMNMDAENRLFTTEMDESNIVMGDVSRLEETIKRLDKQLSPKAIFVMASSASSVIGADVKGVCKYIQDEVSAKIIAFTQSGLGADYSNGIKAGYTDLVSNFANDKYDTEDCYNIIGISSMSHYAKLDLDEIKSMMHQHFNMQAHAVLSHGTSLDEISKMSKAKVNLVLSYEGLEAAKLLYERFGTPYVYGLPVGYDGTSKWLFEVAKALNIEITTTDKTEKITDKGDVMIYADYDLAVSFTSFMEELGLNVVNTICTHNINKVGTPSVKATYLKTEKAKLDLFKALNSTLLLGDNTLMKTANNSNTHVCISSLFFDYCTPVSTLVGFKGADYIKGECEKYIKSLA